MLTLCRYGDWLSCVWLLYETRSRIALTLVYVLLISSSLRPVCSVPRSSQRRRNVQQFGTCTVYPAIVASVLQHASCKTYDLNKPPFRDQLAWINKYPANCVGWLRFVLQSIHHHKCALTLVYMWGFPVRVIYLEREGAAVLDR